MKLDMPKYYHPRQGSSRPLLTSVSGGGGGGGWWVVGCSIYYIKLKVGTPSQEYFLDADTGSSLTWINCKFTKTAKCQKEVSPCQQPNQQFLINTIILQFVEQFL
jgi:hypothetical protein